MSSLASSRREFLQASLGSVAAGLALLTDPRFVFPAQQDQDELVPFLNMPRTGPNRLDWETLDSWLTPSDQVFNVQHYGIPEFDASAYQLEITGLVDKPLTLTLDQLKQRAARDQHMTLECSGNGAGKGFMNAIYNSKWTGTLLKPLLDECGIRPGAREIVFFGHDTKEETLREGSRNELKVEVPFGRSMDLDDALKMDLLLAYARNDEPIEHRNGAPVRLIVPGWYGVANVKWLRRIEVRDRRYMGRYMARDYVTVRGERHGGEIVFVESSVSRMNLKSIVARITRGKTMNGQIPLKAFGAVWNDGTPIDRVEVQVDGGDWQKATIDDSHDEKYCWRFFSIDLGSVPAGKHVVVSRAIDVNGRIQPTAEDDEIALKKTYWEAYQQWPREIEVDA